MWNNCFSDSILCLLLSNYVCKKRLGQHNVWTEVWEHKIVYNNARNLCWNVYMITYLSISITLLVLKIAKFGSLLFVLRIVGWVILFQFNIGPKALLSFLFLLLILQIRLQFRTWKKTYICYCYMHKYVDQFQRKNRMDYIKLTGFHKNSL